MKKSTISLLVLTASVLRLPAAVPLSWTVETSRAQPATFEAYQGETLTFEAALQAKAKPLEAPLNYSFFWQTNGMGSTYWEAPAQGRSGVSPLVGGTNVLFATWLPDYDVGAKVYNCFIGSPSNIYHAAFQLRLRPSPGALPNALPLPTPVIDFARVRVLNPPWSGGGGGGGDTNAVIDIANDTIATNAIVIATTNRVAALETATNNLTSSVSGLQSSKADKSTTYTKAETDAMILDVYGEVQEVDTKASTARSLAQDAQSAADAAQSTADTAQSAADAAMIAAEAAHSAADDAMTEAQAAHAAAGDAYQAADAAQSTADSKADRAALGDADEIATLDADGNPTRSGIAANRIEMVELIADQALSTASMAEGSAQNANEAITFLYNTDLPKKADKTMISATDPTFSNAVKTVMQIEDRAQNLSYTITADDKRFYFTPTGAINPED